MGMIEINQFKEGDKVVDKESRNDYVVTHQKGHKVFVLGLSKWLHANHLKLANGDKADVKEFNELMLDSASLGIKESRAIVKRIKENRDKLNAGGLSIIESRGLSKAIKADVALLNGSASEITNSLPEQVATPGLQNEPTPTDTPLPIPANSDAIDPLEDTGQDGADSAVIQAEEPDHQTAQRHWQIEENRLPELEDGHVPLKLFTPTHYLSDGTPAIHLEASLYADERGDEHEDNYAFPVDNATVTNQLIW